ncbi:MAG: carboxypeptidase-like regulatory domain-containing protein [Pseudobacter sp.]|uniref:carboxypeptidase-like regulatory domain-containing protein n=1 Tax=Pseudobacter sp. TaxID=2045420 RepID=UPI003F7EE6A0
MKRTSLIILLALVTGLLSFCGKKDKDNTSTDSAPYTISGTITDATGKPVAGARIRAENPTGNNIHITGTSGADGKYSIRLTSIGGWKIYAWKEVEMEGNIYQVRLGMENDSDYDAFTPSTKGLTRNFVWRLSGRIPDRTPSKENGTGWFGGSIKIINYNSLVDIMPPGTEVTVTFKPVAGAKYLDGSPAAGKVITKTLTIKDGVGQAYYINDIPATKYIISVASKYNGRALNTYIGYSNPDNFYEGFEFMFPTEGGSGTYESGLGSPNEQSFYMAHEGLI